jgi:hypothetical protein
VYERDAVSLVYCYYLCKWSNTKQAGVY